MEEYRNAEQEERKGTDSSFVLGVLSIVFVAICQVVGLILGIIGLHKARKSETGWTLNVIGIILNAVVIALVIILTVVMLVLFAGVMNSFYYW